MILAIGWVFVVLQWTLLLHDSNWHKRAGAASVGWFLGYLVYVCVLHGHAQ